MGAPVGEDVQRQTYGLASREFSTRPFPTAAAIAGVFSAMQGKIAGADPAHAGDYVDGSFLAALESAGTLDELARRHRWRE
ncbi:MAG TPA: hypothetical protein VG271_04610 [Beijerinckiaceae bacterium]|nr:hypothetical protein [Beijerinckiaceae bacterium]